MQHHATPGEHALGAKPLCVTALQRLTGIPCPVRPMPFASRLAAPVPTTLTPIPMGVAAAMGEPIGEALLTADCSLQPSPHTSRPHMSSNLPHSRCARRLSGALYMCVWAQRRRARARMRRVVACVPVRRVRREKGVHVQGARGGR
jgi:hypothetical protein